ncbi:MAG: InlB B-repeat-containing protein [Treponema sp.]|jgi:uncharacterized repeat protein (TIGR02543 family)|nr:InlB B-repeat-containing protein [Treponema sp.]
MGHKKNIGYFICLSIAFTAIFGCEDMATLFHGPKPEEEETVYTVTFDANGATGTVPAPQKAPSGTAITMPGEGGLAKGSDLFTGWNVSKSGGGTTYPPESSYTVTADQTFYAQWTDPALVYTVTYNANGAAGAAPSPQKVVQNGNIIVADKGNLTYDNKTFNGWNTASEGTETNYSAGDTLTVTANLTLYAQWLDPDAKTYTVTYNANGAGGTPPAPQTVNVGGRITLPGAGGLANSGKTFNGWNTAANGTGTNYNAGDTLTVTANLTLYARWVSAVGSPAWLNVTGQTENSISLSWAAVSGAAEYRVSRSADGNSYDLVKTTTSTTYTDTGLTPATTYHYRVTAYSGQGESSPATVSGTTGGTAPLPPPPPTGLVVSSVASGSVTLSWTGVSNADSYDIFRGNTKDGTPAKVGTATGTSWTDSTAGAGVMRYYSVRAVNTSGSGSSSNGAFACAAAHYSLPTYSSSYKMNLPANAKHYYRLAVSAGQNITITWENGSSQNVYWNVRCTAWQNDGTEIFTNAYEGYTSPRAFTATAAGYVTVEVKSTSGSTAYDYKIYYH